MSKPTKVNSTAFDCTEEFKQELTLALEHISSEDQKGVCTGFILLAVMETDEELQVKRSVSGGKKELIFLAYEASQVPTMIPKQEDSGVDLRSLLGRLMESRAAEESEKS